MSILYCHKISVCCRYLYDLIGTKLYDFKCHELMKNEQRWTSFVMMSLIYVKAKCYCRKLFSTVVPIEKSVKSVGRI